MSLRHSELWQERRVGLLCTSATNFGTGPARLYPESRRRSRRCRALTDSRNAQFDEQRKLSLFKSLDCAVCQSQTV